MGYFNISGLEPIGKGLEAIAKALAGPGRQQDYALTPVAQNPDISQEEPQEATARDLLRAMLGSDEIANSQSGTLWRFVNKFAKQFGEPVTFEEPQPWELPGYPGEPEAHEPWAKVIWETSRADEGSISATGANIIAKALLAAMGRGELKVPRLELVVNGELQDPSNPQAWKIGPGHVVEVPEEPPHPLLEVLERIAEAIENSGPDNEALNSIAGALDDIERQRR